MRYACLIFVLGMVVGCATPPSNGNGGQTDFIKDMACEKENGAYTGNGQPMAISVVALAVKLGASKFGVDIDDETANKIAVETLKLYCSGKIDDLFGSLNITMLNHGFSSDISDNAVKNLRIIKGK